MRPRQSAWATPAALSGGHVYRNSQRAVVLLSLLLAICTGVPVHAQADEFGPVVDLASISNLPDFSYAGRASAAQEPPTVTRETHAYFDVTEFGAVPGDGLSDREAVERAIAAAEAHDGPAVVWFPAGRFVLRGSNDVGAQSIRVRRSEVVLKGAGMYSGGTELFLASESEATAAFLFKPVLDPSAGWRGARTLTKLSVVPRRGQREVVVSDHVELAAGDIVRLSGVLPDTFTEFRRFFEPLGDDALIEKFFLRSSGGGYDWRSDFLSTLEIESVNGHIVRFKQPLVADYEFVSQTYRGGPKLVQIFAEGDSLLRDVGVEDLAFVSNYRDAYWHFFNRAAEGYDFLELRNVRESWVRRVRMRSGTKGILFGSNGMNNVVYDVLFEGNSGHYSITTAGNMTGNQASFLRESSPAQHGFGATLSAFGTVYHRCNQFGGPEGHGGYPQGTLYDVNEGDLSLVRVGGGPPHLSKFTVFWNWNQALFVPKASGIRGHDNRFVATSLVSQKIDFWPATIMRPIMVGLHGTPLFIADAKEDLEVSLHHGHRVQPESLFEEQLRARLGEVPTWLSLRADSFERVSRYSQIDIDWPIDGTVVKQGNRLYVTLRLHPNFDRLELERVQLYAARGHNLDVEELVVAESFDRNARGLFWTPPDSGAWRIRVVLVNSLGEESTSKARYVFVKPSFATPDYARAEDAWLQPRSLNPAGISNASRDIAYADATQYRAQVRIREKPLVQAVIDDPENRRVARRLIDGNFASNATGPAALRWWGVKGFVFDLGIRQQIQWVELVAPWGTSARQDYFGQFYVQVSDDAGAQYSYTNSDLVWRTVRRMGDARTTARLRLDRSGRFKIFLPEETEARFVRLVIGKLDSRGAHEGDLSEIRFGRFTDM